MTLGQTGRCRYRLGYPTLALLALACHYEAYVPLSPGNGRNTVFVDGVDPSHCPTVAPPSLKATSEACACDIQCQTGSCVGGICCTAEACSALRPLGITCQDGSQCGSGFCADGVCCNVACTGACVACNRPYQMGQCAVIPAGGEDRHGICRKDPPETCGQTGYCNGSGGCTRYPAITVCRPSYCASRERFVAASLCDGDGSCVAGGAGSCSPSICEAGSCLASCTGDDSCLAPSRCVAGSCGPKGLGQDCLSQGECASGFCADGVCCDSSCGTPCMFCASADARGRCVPVKAALPDQRAARGEKDPATICVDQGSAACGRNGHCDGQGGCQTYPDGTICADARCDDPGNVELPAATCASGMCRAAPARSCTPYAGCSGTRCRTTCGGDTQCTPGNVCVAGDCGKRPNGAVCARAGDCASDVCAQGRCCATACNGTCRSCALPGQEGTCASVAAGGVDPTGTCRDDACSNGCDGAGGCRRETVGTVCGAATCAADGSLVSRLCTSVGACATTSTTCASGQVCSEGRCATPPPPPPTQQPPPPPPAVPTTKYFCDTFATGLGYRGPNCLHSTDPACAAVGRLFAQNNYVFCKRFGDEMRVGVDFNHWWLLTDLDENFPGFSGRAYVSAYYLTRWGNDVAKDNLGQVIPDCP